MRVLVGCESSGIVRDAFAALGHDAWSCDLLPGERPGQHIQSDVLEVLEEGWDLAIFYPPCTYLCRSGLHWNGRREGREEKTHDAMLFVFNLMGEGFVNNPIPRIALENPVGRIGSAYRKPDQILQPYQFGHDASKATCLWLRGLPPLRPTLFVEPRMVCCGKVIDSGDKYGCPNCNGEKVARPRWGNQCDSGQNRLGPYGDRWKDRARTYEGIARAMAEQWSTFVTGLNDQAHPA